MISGGPISAAPISALVDSTASAAVQLNWLQETANPICRQRVREGLFSQSFVVPETPVIPFDWHQNPMAPPARIKAREGAFDRSFVIPETPVTAFDWFQAPAAPLARVKASEEWFSFLTVVAEPLTPFDWVQSPVAPLARVKAREGLFDRSFVMPDNPVTPLDWYQEHPAPPIRYKAREGLFDRSFIMPDVAITPLDWFQEQPAPPLRRKAREGMFDRSFVMPDVRVVIDWNVQGIVPVRRVLRREGITLAAPVTVITPIVSWMPEAEIPVRLRRIVLPPAQEVRSYVVPESPVNLSWLVQHPGPVSRMPFPNIHRFFTTWIFVDSTSALPCPYRPHRADEIESGRLRVDEFVTWSSRPDESETGRKRPDECR